jgi:hypothetical protein
MVKHLRSLFAIAFLWCLLLPATALPRMYAPNDPKSGTADGHPSGGLMTRVMIPTGSPGWHTKGGTRWVICLAANLFLGDIALNQWTTQ